MMEKIELNKLFDMDLTDPSQKSILVDRVDNFGKHAIESSQRSNNLLATQLVKFEKGGQNSRDIGKSLASLSIQMENLDPSSVDFAKTGFLGRFFNPAREYFKKYEKADDVINKIVQSLDKGANALSYDNITLDEDAKILNLKTEEIKKNVQKNLEDDAIIEEQILKAELDDNILPEHIKFVKEEVLFPLRQNTQDMQAMILVNQQSIASIEIIRKNNRELIRSVDRAKNVTITALQTGAMIASALYNQKIVIDKIEALNKTTNKQLESNAKMIRSNGTSIYKQSVNSSIDISSITKAFEDVELAMDEVDKVKVENLSRMKENINAFNEMSKRGQAIVDRMTGIEQKSQKNISA